MSRPLIALLVALTFLASACGVNSQRHPETITLDPSQEATTPRPTDPSPMTVIVYFIDGERLKPVTRGVPDRSASSMLQALAGGPTGSEVLAGVRTAIPPQKFRVWISDTSASVAVIQVSQGFVSISGENQLLAVAQLVWTVTQRPGIERARLELAGEPVEVPTDRGLVGYPVSRSDFASVRPAGVDLSEITSAQTDPAAGTASAAASTSGGGGWPLRRS